MQVFFRSSLLLGYEGKCNAAVAYRDSPPPAKVDQQECWRPRVPHSSLTHYPSRGGEDLVRADRPPQAPPRLPCRCIPGAGEARDEAAAAAMRSRWLARRAPASEAGLRAGSGF